MVSSHRQRAQPTNVTLNWHVQTEIQEKLASMYGVDSVECISVFGFRTQVRHCHTRHISHWIVTGDSMTHIWAIPLEQ